ncbi:MAG: hypothetical protein ACTSP3_14215 [Candidatus Heimdallarchaeaceae archaeon]
MGERIVYFWLKNFEYSDQERYEIIEQVVPSELHSHGNYLDFGVLEENKLIAFYEVKAQDYILDKDAFNKALLSIWDQEFELRKCKSLAGIEYEIIDDFKAFLVLLVPPNKKTVTEKLLPNELKNIILFEEIFAKISTEQIAQIKEEITEKMQKDYDEEIEALKNPTQGKRLLKIFKAAKKTKS